jgi:predicted transcriptional regulator
VRTTIELTDEQRARLLQIAASRGEKGFSRLVQEAIDLYLEGQSRRGEAIQRALAVRGKLPKSDADELEARVVAIRKEWR